MLSFARKPSGLVYRQPLLTRAAGAGFAVVVLVVLLALWRQVLDLSLPDSAMLALGVLWFAMIATCVRMALAVRIAFIFGADGVVARERWGTRTLAYADIAGCTVVHEERPVARGQVVRGFSVTFQAMRRGVRPLELFVHERVPLDPAIVRRLKTVPGLSERQLKLLELASSVHVNRQRLARTPAGEV
jgi:hypothetical protein